MTAPTFLTHSTNRWSLVLFFCSVLLYCFLALLVEPERLIGDEERYVMLARNLTQGFYVTDDHPDILNGPGYPLVLVPFVLLKLSFLWARMLNGIFIGAAVVLLYRTIRPYGGAAWAALAAWAVMLHPNSMRTGMQLLTEPLTLACMSAWLWCFCHCCRAESKVWLWGLAAAAALAALVMTRVLFGHVMLAMLVASVVGMLFWRKHRMVLIRTFCVLVAAFALCSPYLAYTKAKTGKNLCWSTVCGEFLYWMTSTNPGENGYWFSYQAAMSDVELAPYHGEFFQRVTALPVLERDAAFAEQAKKQLQANPAGALRNWLTNVVRLPLDFPRSHHAEELSTAMIVFFNVPLLLATAAAAVLALRRPHSLPPELWVLALFTFVYLGGSTLASSLARYFLVVTPPLWLLVAAAFSRNVEARLVPVDKSPIAPPA